MIPAAPKNCTTCCSCRLRRSLWLCRSTLIPALAIVLCLGTGLRTQELGIAGLGIALAQTTDYELMASSAAGGEGSIVTVEVSLDVVAGAAPVSGWSFSLAHDPVHSFVGATVSPTLGALNGGAGPDYVTISAATGGWLSGVVVDFQQSEVISSGSYLMYSAEYELGAVIGTTPLDFTTLGVPPIEPIVVGEIIPGTQEFSPTLTSGALIVEPYTLILESKSASVGSSVEIAAQMTTPDGIDAFELGIGHDPADLQVTGVVPGALLAAVGGGAGPELFALDLLTDGYTLSVTIDSSGVSGELLPAATDAPLVIATYDVDFAAAMPVDIAFSSSVGTGVATAFHRGASSFALQLTPGAITLADSSMLRGDCDGNADIQITDAVVALAFLFTLGTVPCLDACDFGSDGTVNIADPVGMLDYLFAMGPPPSAPFPDCGPAGVVLGCGPNSCP